MMIHINDYFKFNIQIFKLQFYRKFMLQKSFKFSYRSVETNRKIFWTNLIQKQQKITGKMCK